MAKTTEKYELMYIINPNLSEEETAAVVEKFKALVEQNGTLEEMEEMGSASSLTRSTTRAKATMYSTTSSPSLTSPWSLSVSSTSLTAFSVPSLYSHRVSSSNFRR